MSLTTSKVAQTRPTVKRFVGEVTVASPFMDPEQSLGPFGRDPVRDFRLSRDADLPPFVGKDTGDLYDYCQEHYLYLDNHVNVGRERGYTRYMAWHRFLIVEEA